MEKKQTAVDYLWHDLIANPGNYIKAYKQAKEMEKQQIIETWHNGYENQSPMIDEDNCGEQYYNENYKSK